MKQIYFVDFDNTISTTDVGNAVQDHFSAPGWREFNGRFLEGEIGSREALHKQHEFMRCTENEFRRYARTFEIDPRFPEFLGRVRDAGDEIRIVSDGVKTYIDILFEKYGIEDVEIFANDLRFLDNRVEYLFPYAEIGCPHDPPCGNCKLMHVRNAPNGVQKVYIGDGQSDVRAVEGVDRIYAKARLRAYCEREGIPHTPFESFSDILRNGV